jgi:hypothetical protein
MARYRAEQATHRNRAEQAASLTPKQTPTDRESILIAPPGFGPDPAGPPKWSSRLAATHALKPAAAEASRASAIIPPCRSSC